ncbi:hypothetical protein IMY05_017G0121400 [Salix suchowensis]|nr:hypothetical protein IMY05_017G0121400 [Salix suchowensis]
MDWWVFFVFKDKSLKMSHGVLAVAVNICEVSFADWRTLIKGRAKRQTLVLRTSGVNFFSSRGQLGLHGAILTTLVLKSDE